MKHLVLKVICAFLVLGGTAGAQEASPAGKTTVKLASGDTMTGTVGTVRDGSLSLITEYGPVRIPVDKLSSETKVQLGISGNVDAASFRQRIIELEDLVARLREENASLRRGAIAVVQPAVGGTSAAVKTAAPSSAGESYKISSTGKRHNARCRYYGSAGRMGGASEGVACKICGG